MSSDNLNSIDDKTDPLSSAAKHMDERLRGANQSAIAGAQNPSAGTNALPATDKISTGLRAISIPTDLKAYLTLLAIPIGISLFAGFCRGRDADSA